MEQESDAWIERHGTVSTGECAFTNAGRLPCKIVIHAVGPMYSKQDSERCFELLYQCVSNALSMAESLDIKSIAIPAISSGTPKEEVAETILKACVDFVKRGDADALTDVRLTNFDKLTCSVFISKWSELGLNN